MYATCINNLHLGTCHLLEEGLVQMGGGSLRRGSPKIEAGLWGGPYHFL